VIIILLDCIILVIANIVRMYNICIVRVYFVQYILYWYELRTDVIDIIPVRTKDGWVYSYRLRTDGLLGIIRVRTKDGWIYLLHRSLFGFKYHNFSLPTQSCFPNMMLDKCKFLCYLYMGLYKNHCLPIPADVITIFPLTTKKYELLKREIT
jgi:hypothetical protein